MELQKYVEPVVRPEIARTWVVVAITFLDRAQRCRDRAHETSDPVGAVALSRLSDSQQEIVLDNGPLHDSRGSAVELPEHCGHRLVDRLDRAHPRTAPAAKRPLAQCAALRAERLERRCIADTEGAGQGIGGDPGERRI
jgi:hypothetical protein